MTSPDRTVTFYHRVDDPYSHLLAQSLPALSEAYDIALEHRMVPEPDADMAPDAARLATYGVDDCVELGRYYEVDFPADAALPAPAAVRQATAILAAIEETDAFVAAAVEVGAALWRGDGGALAAIAESHGAADADAALAALAAGKAELTERGHYFGGMLYYGGDWFWGIDRLGWLEERLRADGLAREGAPRSVLRRRVPPDAPAARSDEVAQLDFYLSFRSPYSYLGLARILDLPKRYPVALEIKPVLPMVMRGLPVPAAKLGYIMKDLRREAQKHGVPIADFRDPLGAGVERGMAVFTYAKRDGREADFVRSFTSGVWADGLDSATDEGLRAIVERAGLDWAEAERHLGDESWRNWEKANQDELFALGLWGVPSFRLGAYRAWGQDRIWILEEKLKAATGSA